MEPILQITTMESDDDNFLSYQVIVTQGAEQILTEENLLENIQRSIPYKKGIINTQQVSPDTWHITCNK